MKLFKKKGSRYHEATDAEIVQQAVRVLNRVPGGQEVTDFLTLKALQGKVVIRDEVHEDEN